MKTLRVNIRKILKHSLLSVVIAAGASLANADITKTVTGKYHWQLVFDYDNTKNNGEITHEARVTTRETISKKTFLSRTFGQSWANTKVKDVAVELDYVKVKAKAGIKHTLHETLSQKLVDTTDIDKTDYKEQVVTRKYIIGPNSKFQLYRLVYTQPGVVAETDIFTTTPSDPEEVIIEYTLIENTEGHNRHDLASAVLADINTDVASDLHSGHFGGNAFTTYRHITKFRSLDVSEKLNEIKINYSCEAVTDSLLINGVAYKGGHVKFNDSVSVKIDKESAKDGLIKFTSTVRHPMDTSEVLFNTYGSEHVPQALGNSCGDKYKIALSKLNYLQI